MRTERRHRFIWYVALLAAMLIPATLLAEVPCGSDIEILAKVDAIRALAPMSESIWPGWDIGDLPMAVHRPGECCYLMGHPKPPPGFTRLRGDLPFKTTVYCASGRTPRLDASACLVAGVPTVIVSTDEPVGNLLTATFREAFRVHLRDVCPATAEEVVLLTGYPVDASGLAMADIECRLLRMAATAPEDSLEQRVLEFVTVRSFRRISLVDRYVHYERHREFASGVPLYVEERCREQAPSDLRGDVRALLNDTFGGAGHVLDHLTGDYDLDWYRTERFRYTGAALCVVLDRILPNWKADVAERCVAPDVLLFEHAGPLRLDAQEVLGRHDYAALVAHKEQVIESSKSAPERLFEEVTQGEGLTITVNTSHLSGGSVRFDPQNMARIDEHRSVHERILKIEYSGGTHVYVVGRPVAVVLGGDEFDFRQLIFPAPDDLTVVADGDTLIVAASDTLSVERGIHHVDHELLVSGTGLSIVAAQATVVLGGDRISLGLVR